MSGLSKNNARIRELRKIIKGSKQRLQSEKFAIEGLELLREAISTGHFPIDIFLSESSTLSGSVEELVQETDAKIWSISDDLLSSLASTVNPQPVISTLPIFNYSIDNLLSPLANFLVVGLGINEPGNAGSIIRSAAAAGAQGVVFSKNSVDIFNPKAVRSSSGAIFRVPISIGFEDVQIIRSLKQVDMSLIGLSGEGSTTYTAIDFLRPFAILVGNESTGLQTEVLQEVDHLVSIPMDAGVESLNVAIAASIVSYEAKRQRLL